MDAVAPRVLAYLGRALSLELTAVQQYMFQASLAESWGDQDSAQRFRQETVEEMQHAEKIVQRMLSLGVAPSASQLRPVTHAPDLVGLLQLNSVLENDLIQHYAEAVRFCLLHGDADNGAFFRGLWSDEQHHGAELADWLASLDSPRVLAAERAMF
ncbi:MAG: ferritin-like domain-containing protein [Cyanobacteriota bacterium]|jgi:bacterioferritin